MCWCVPHLEKVCEHCDGDGILCVGHQCPYCQGEGWVQATAEEAERGIPVVVIHHLFV
jgi:DnaJ-class molecular chaperone